MAQSNILENVQYMNIEIVAIGDELLLGFITNTNAAYLARELAPLGVRIMRSTTCADDAEAIAAAVGEALERSDGVITTGGLGPTADDKSKPAVASLFGRKMVMHADILAALEARWQNRYGHPLPPGNRQQALMPEGCVVLGNNHGTAPGVWLENESGRWVAMLPGEPREVRGMLADTLLPRLRLRIPKDAPVISTLTLRSTGIAESALADRLGELAAGVDGLPLAFLPGNDGVDLRLTAWSLPREVAASALATAAQRIRERVGQWIYGEADEDLAHLILEQCVERRLTIAVAESCTGGGLGSRLTAIPGSSRSVLGGVIAYANEVKIRELGVGPDVLERVGAVSEEVALAMASGVRERFGAGVGLSITGIAGPDGGTPEKPVGTVWVGLSMAGQDMAVRGLLPGNRPEIRYRAAQMALDQLRRRFVALGFAAPGGASESTHAASVASRSERIGWTTRVS